jgi:WD40 repeat protein
MEAKLLEKRRWMLRAKTPLIGGWLRRRAILSLIEDGSTEATIALVEAAMRGQDEIDSVTAAQYAPRDTRQRALFYFLTGRWEEYESLDFDHAFLRAAYEIGDERLRGRIAQRARRDGRVEWIAVVTGGRQKRRLGEMSREEWDAALAVLFASRRWEELWQMAQEAPPRWSARILRRMNGSGWRLSSEDERRECEALIELAMNWIEPEWSSSTCREVELESGWPVHRLAISPDGSLMAIEIEGKSCSGRGAWRLREWSLPSGQLSKTLEGGQYVHPNKCVVINPGARLLAIVEYNDKTIQIRSPTDVRFINLLTGHPYPVSGLAVSPDGRLLVSVSPDMPWKRHIYDRQRNERNGGRSVSIEALREALRKILNPSFPTCLLIFSWIVAICLLVLAVRVLAVRHRHDEAAFNDWLFELGSKRSSTDLYHFFKAKSWSKAREESAFAIAILCCIPLFSLLWVFIPVGYKRLAGWWRNRRSVPKEDCEMRVWSLPEGLLLKTMKVPRQIVSCIAISTDGGMLVSGNTNGKVQLRKLPDGRLIKELEGQGVSVTRLAFSPDGQLLVSGDRSGAVRLWSLPDGRLIKTLEGEPGGVTCLAISPDGRVLAGGGTACVRLWSLPDCKLIKIWDWGQSPDGHDFSNLAFYPDGSILAYGGKDGTVRLLIANLLRLSELPVAEAGRSDFNWVQEMLHDKKPSGSERRALEFMAALMRLRRRFEIEVAEPIRRTGKYDIEIDG